ncbi:nhaA [Symbiodinium sp. KB8]|nr:nhaA [Symbiodinium sp. KB8]
MSGLPEAAVGQVTQALLTRAREGVQKDSQAGLKRDYAECDRKDAQVSSELVDPAQGDEACLVLTLLDDQIPASSSICAAFVRLKVALPMNFAANTPVRFLIVLACHSDRENDLTELSESLAALAVDEDLILKMARAKDAAAFVAAFDSRLGEIVLLPHAHVHSRRNFEDDVLLSPKGAVPQSPKSVRMKRRPSMDEAGNVITSVKSDVGFDHMHKHGPGDDTEELPSLQKHVWRAVGVLQKYALPLVTGVIVAMVWKNTAEDSYWTVTHDPIIPGWQILGHDASLHFLINDIFMCFFFGLAIKEVTEALLPGGSLSPLRRATNPLMATLGGVLGPVATYVVAVLIFDSFGSFNGMQCQHPASEVADASHRLLAGSGDAEVPMVTVDCTLADIINGWGVPTATDISLAWMFAILIFGAGHPAINYLLLLAIADDALGMAIIAIAYPNPAHPVEPVWLLLVVVGAVVACFLRMAKVRFWSAYVFIAGPIAWLGLILAQVHPALALVFIVPFMPAHHAHGGGDDHVSHAKSQVAKVRDLIPHNKSEMLIRAAQEFMARQSAPLHAFEHHMKLFVDFGMFFFGLANAGVKVGGLGSLTWATVIALIAGKTLGIVFFSLSAHCMGFLLPVGLTVVDLFAMSALGGVGLTVALFVSNEAFTDKGLQSQAKMGALLSVASALVAFLLKFFGDRVFHRRKPCEEEPTETNVEVVYSDDEVEADEWLDVVAMNDIMQVLWTQRKYQSRGTALPIRKLVRTVSKNSTAWNRMELDGQRSSAWGRMTTPGSKDGREEVLARSSKTSHDEATRAGSKE